MMRAMAQKQKSWSEELLERASEFHGHGGPFMVVGLRMGLEALRRLGASGWFDVRCRVELNWRPPDSCVIDGIQVSTGCTMGKRNIEVSDAEGIAAEFNKGEEHLRMVLRNEVLDRMRRTLATGEGAAPLVEEIAKADPSDLFEFH